MSNDLRAAAAALGRKGGRVTSDAKAAAARENGKKGGRPRKEKPTMTHYVVERTDWYGDCDTIGRFTDREAAQALCEQCRRESKAVDDPADKIRYRVVAEDIAPVTTTTG